MKARVIKPVVVAPDINVTPLIDVVLVLLIIFMVITPLLHDDLEVQLPLIEQVETQEELPDEQLLVHVTQGAELKINEVLVAREDYVETLRAKLGAQKNKIVFVATDKQASYELVVLALDGARRAGAQTLGLTTTPADVEVELAPVPTPSPE